MSDVTAYDIALDQLRIAVAQQQFNQRHCGLPDLSLPRTTGERLEELAVRMRHLEAMAYRRPESVPDALVTLMAACAHWWAECWQREVVDVASGEAA